jgi:carbon storage regulator
MLILSRYPRQVVMVGRDIQILIVDITRDRVRLGITAPKEIRVRRQEANPDPPPQLAP